MILLYVSKKMHISFAVLANLADGLRLGALLAIKVEKSLIYHVATRMLTLSTTEWQK
jgi:hypothetical protein